MNITELRDEILNLNEEIKQKQKEAKEKIEILQKECKHEYCVHTPYLPLTYCNDLQASRICIFCGLEEDSSETLRLGKSKILKSVERNEFYKYRTLKPITMVAIPDV